MISSGCSGVTSAKGSSTTTNTASLSINTPALPGAITQTAYSGALSASGGITPYTWSITSGSLPPGLTLNSSSGAITGTPTTAGTFTFTAQAKDSSPTPETATASASVLTVDLLQITTTSLPDPQVQTSYSATLTASGGMTPYLWSISSGSLPPGLSLDSSTGVISGVPTSTGSYAFTVEVSDPPSFPQKSKKNLNATVQPKTLQITTSGLPNGQVQTAYSAALAATGGTTPYSWSIRAGALPAGLSLNASTGAISGTPTQSGTFSSTAQVTDSVSLTAQQALNITVNAAAVAPSITTQPASQTLIAGQTATLSVTATGTSPLTYQWNKNGTAISGATSSTYTTPATTSSDNGAQFTVTISNSAGTVTSNAATLTVNTPPSITTQPVSQAVTVGQTASFSVAATGTAPLGYQWSKNGTAISGATSSTYTTPATTSSDNGAQFTAAVSNPAGTVTSNTATLTVTPAPVAPSITTQPVSQTVTVGQTASFSVTASGTSPLTYQWNKNAAAMSGATSSTYTTPATSSSDNGAQFTVTVSNSAGSVTSNAATLTVNTPPSITAQPTSQTVTAGQTATFSVTASGTAPLSYQWQKNGAAISGATSASYTTPATTSSDNGAQFTVIVSNSVGTVTSNVATLTVNTPPSITTQPLSQTVTAGQTATFSVAAMGTAPLGYQWNKNGAAISGATSASYTTPATTIADNGAQFTVVVSNSAGSVTSNAATLTVNTPPSITTQPVSQTVTVGQTASFSVTASGTSPLSYQWNKNGTAISGATSSTYTTPATTSSDNGAQFAVTVSNLVGTVTGNSATLTVTPAPVAPSITTQPASQTLIAGQTATLSVTATGTSPLTYQWNKNGTAISGATAASYTTPATTSSDNGAQFIVTVSNSAGSVTSNAATLTVNTPPSITTQPVSQTVTSGQTANFSIAVTGTAPLTYQWNKNGTAISGATSSSYTTPATISSDNGAQFAVTISNSAGTVTSNAATLTVNTPPSITTQPASQTVTAGQTATFSVTASGTSPLSYQWQKNGAAISGATSSSYTTPAETTSDNGALFTVTVSNSAGTATSNNAALTVNPAPVAPSITTQPSSQTITAGQTATFSVTASGTTPLSYQWSKNGAAISGATAASYTTPATTSSDNGAQFTVTVSNSAGSVTSSAATLTVNVAPSITTQPASQTVTVGQTATFSVTASGTTPFSYQWQKNGVAISGATSANYTTPATISSDNGAQFTVTISNSAGSATSNAATLTVNAAAVAPSISTQPASQTVPAGQTATFSVTATGTAPLSYQWQKNGTAVSGATSSTYTTPATTTSGSGTQFTVTVSNSAGSATSNAATLTVTSYVLTATPSSFSLSAQAGGAVLTQTVSINDTTPGPLPFTLSTDKSWITLSATSGTTQSGGTPMQFSVNPSGLAAGTYSGNIFVTASGVTNSPLAIPVTLAVSPAVAPSITTQPLSQTVTAGQTATFAVVATGTSPLAYQWQKNGTTISGAASLSYTTPATISSDNGTQFTVTVSNSAGSATSNAATLTVNAATPGALAPSTTSLSFGNVIVSSNSVLGVNFTNSGSVNITVSNVTISGAGFTASGVSNGQIITPGQVVTLNVTFAPAATGSTTGNVTVASNASNSPTSISLSGSGVLAHSATLSWTASTSTVIGYNVYRGPVSGGPYTLVNSSLVAGTQYVDSTVLAGQIYYYVATAVASGNVESTYSNQVSATIPTP